MTTNGLDPGPLYDGAGRSFYCTGFNALRTKLCEECKRALEQVKALRRMQEKLSASLGFQKALQKEGVRLQEGPIQQECSPYAKGAEVTINQVEDPQYCTVKVCII